MTDAEIDSMTIGDVKRVVERASDALAKFAEARALLTGELPRAVGDDYYAPPRSANKRPPSTKGEKSELTDEERAQRDVLVAQSRGIGLSEAEEAEFLAQAVRR